MNKYIPVLDECPPAGFVGNYSWKHHGPETIAGHTPPRRLEVVCPCLECLAEHLGPEGDAYVLGPVWISNKDFTSKIPELVGVYERQSMARGEQNEPFDPGA